MHIQTVIKRDGQREDFQLQKLINKAVWAVVGFEGRLDWTTSVKETLTFIQDSEVSSTVLDKKLEEYLLSAGSWPANVAAGRIHLASLRKKMWWNKELVLQNELPTVWQVQQYLMSIGLMEEMGYSITEYNQIEEFIDHRLDFNMAHFQISQIYKKYGLQNNVTGARYELPQFVFMRMAMAINQHRKENKLEHVKRSYEALRSKIVAPTPNYNNLGTPHRGLASCCIYAVDDNRRSMAAGKHIAFTMTYMSAGIGNAIMCRSIGDPVRDGSIIHRGKQPYYYSMGGDVTENKQGSRSGACTTYVSMFDPEAKDIMRLQNPRTPTDVQNRKIHFAFNDHVVLGEMVMNDEEYVPFNVYTAPQLTKLFYSGDAKQFKIAYQDWMKSNPALPRFKARDLSETLMQQAYEVGTNYWESVNEINRHTPFKDPIYTGNLCIEVLEPTLPYQDVRDLYLEENHGRGEVAMCNLFAIPLPNIDSEEDYRQAMLEGMEMAEYCIDNAHYELPHIGYTAKRRRSIGVGVIGLATMLARKGLKYDTQEGLNYIHQLMERHAWHAINASLELGQKYGNAPWMHKTKWPDGWLPIDTYNRNVDELVTVGNQYNWEELRAKVIKNGGIRHSVLCSLQPTESSSKSAAYPNAHLPVRDLELRKTDGSNAIEWVAYDNDILNYQLAWDIKPVDMIKVHAVCQKWFDQGISADVYRDRRVNIDFNTSDLNEEYMAMHYYGQKTRYYSNSITTNQSNKSEGSGDCASGACKM